MAEEGGNDAAERTRTCIHPVERCFLNPTNIHGVSVLLLVHNSFKSLVTMEEERELKSGFKVKGQSKTEKT